MHRDLKPDNVMIHNGEVVLGDFGEGKLVEEGQEEHTIKGCILNFQFYLNNP